MPSLSKINVGLRIAHFIGFVLSLYAFIVETSKEHDPSYTAMCDINEHVSCSRVFTSKYGRGFGLLHYLVGEDSVLNQPNSVGGMIFFIMFFVMSFRDTVSVSMLLYGLSIGSSVCCVYLAYVLYFVLHDFCIVCISTYVVNAVNLVLCSAKLQLLRNSKKPDTLKAKND